MKVTSFTKREFNKLPLLELDKRLYNQEADLYVVQSKNKWNNDSLVFKRFRDASGTYFSNKLYTINELSDKKDVIDLEELCIPLSLGVIDEDVQGYIMPYIRGNNLKTIMLDYSISFDIKIHYLKEVGKILERIRRVRKYTGVKDFYLNDIHEGNFVVDSTGNIHVVDLDSVKIGSNEPMIAKYLYDRKISEVTKYQVNDSAYTSSIIPDENTDIYCYIVMIFNLFYKEDIDKLSIEEFYNYLEYLYRIGVSREFIEIISYIYSNHDNINPYEYLDMFAKFYGRTDKDVYKLNRSRG